jgi:hypothetical protein
MGSPFGVEIIGESDGLTTLEYIEISKEPVYVELSFRPSDRAYVVFSKIFREEMAPFVSVINILLTTDDKHPAHWPFILIKWRVGQSLRGDSFPAHFFQEGWRFAVAAKPIVENWIDHADGIFHYVSPPFLSEPEAHQMQVSGASSDRSIGAFSGGFRTCCRRLRDLFVDVPLNHLGGLRKQEDLMVSVSSGLRGFSGEFSGIRCPDISEHGEQEHKKSQYFNDRQDRGQTYEAVLKRFFSLVVALFLGGILSCVGAIAIC